MVNGVNSPLLRTLAVAPLASGAGHIAGGTTAGLLEGQSLGNSFGGSFEGIEKSIGWRTAIGVATTVGMSYANGVNLLSGRTLGIKNQGVLTDNGIYATQKGLNQEIVNMYLEQMKSGTFDLNHRIGGFKSGGNYYIGDGHHRINAALMYYHQTGNNMYLNYLINTGFWTSGHPSDYGLKIYNID